MRLPVESSADRTFDWVDHMFSFKTTTDHLLLHFGQTRRNVIIMG
jgi:hypothetical protein